MEVWIPIITRSEPNLRDHWARRARRARRQREAAFLCTRSGLAKLPPSHAALSARKPVTITLTRIGPGRLDSDNLAGALKAVRDGVADALGVNDGNPRLSWLYGQRKGKPGEYAVLVQIE